MKIAVTYENGRVFQHFGHSKAFKIYEVENGAVQSSAVVPAGGAGHGALAGFLKERGVQALICGGIGAGAEGLFAVCESTIQTTVSKPMALSEAIENARTLYLDAAKRLFRAVRIGQKLHV